MAPGLATVSSLRSSFLPPQSLKVARGPRLPARTVKSATVTCRYSVRTMGSRPSPLVEHIVLFKARLDATPEELQSLVMESRKLVVLSTLKHFSFDPVVPSHPSLPFRLPSQPQLVSAGAVLSSTVIEQAGALSRNGAGSGHVGQSSQNGKNGASADSAVELPFLWTHVLHGRYATKADLAAYSDHPTHKSIVASYIQPNVSSLLALDWEAEVDPVSFPSGSIVQIIGLKFKDTLGEDERKAAVDGYLKSVGGVSELGIPQGGGPTRNQNVSPNGNLNQGGIGTPLVQNRVVQTSHGANFSVRSKGFNWGVLLVFENEQAMLARGVDRAMLRESLGEYIEDCFIAAVEVQTPVHTPSRF